MEGVAGTLGFFITLAGFLSLAVSVYVWKYLVPRESVTALRGELDYQLRRIGEKDNELKEFRAQRQGDLKRLEADEANIQRLDQEVRELRAWRYGAERYIRDLEAVLKRHDITAPDRMHYGLNGEEQER